MIMFSTEDLPLFSATPLRAPLATPEFEAGPPGPLPAECEFCRATGLVGLCLFSDTTYCWREAERPTRGETQLTDQGQERWIPGQTNGMNKECDGAASNGKC
jgi:hypothetical protein